MTGSVRAVLRRLDGFRAGPAATIGLVAGAAVGAFLATSSSPAAVLAFVGVLTIATLLALTAEPVAVEESERSAPREPAPGEERVHPVDGSVLVYVPGGTYSLGAADLDELFNPEIAKRSRPVHRVRLSGFWIAQHPVTNARYRRFLEQNPDAATPEFWEDERFNDDRQPVVGVSWDEARAYCRWAGLELPSEAQWEAAARGTDQRRYPWGDEAPSEALADFDQDFRTGRPEPVGSHPAGKGPFGTLDQAGTVWEWCLDRWDPEAYRERDGKTDPILLAEDEGGVRVLRGGSWNDPAWDLAAAIRYRLGSSYRDQFVGFRCASPVPAEP